MRARAPAAPASGGAKEGLVAWWKLDEQEGSSAADASGNSLQASLKGTPRWAGPRSPDGGGLEFDGSRSFVQCDDAKEVASHENLSVAVWFKGPANDDAEDRSGVLASKGEAWQLVRSQKDGTVNLSLAGPRTPEKSRYQGGMPNLSSKRKLDDGRWHHAVGTYDGTRAVLYIDGTEEEAVEASGPLALTSAPVTLGDTAISPGQFFDGALADARIYSRALTPDEVRALYGAEKKP
ncbi:MAG: LamG domain-containing protein [Verrucomicrobiia bacterium]